MKFQATQTVKVPAIIVNNGNPRNPTAIKSKTLRKGMFVDGTLQSDAKGNPVAITTADGYVIPANCVRKVLTQELTMSKVEGNTTNKPAPEISGQISLSKDGVATRIDTKKKYVDAVLFGAVAGFAATVLIEKKTSWLPEATAQNKIVGAIVGIVAGIYIVYRFGDKIYK